MSLVYETIAQLTTLAGENVVSAGEEVPIRIFAETDQFTFSESGVGSGVEIYDLELGTFSRPTEVQAISYQGAEGTVHFFVAMEVGSRAFELEVEGRPFIDFPPGTPIEDFGQFGINSFFFPSLGGGPFAFGQSFDFDDLAGVSFLGETGQGVSEQRAKNIALLYETALNRNGNIDEPGLNFWLDVAERGATNREIAAAFPASPEFQAAFGDVSELSDEDYVDLLYQNTLDRAGDAPGQAFWVGQLDAGASRAELLFAFAISVENQQTLEFVNTLTETAPGEWEFIG